MNALSDELSPVGWPRPWLLWTPSAGGTRAQAMPRILPVPWINGANPYRGDWVSLDEDRAAQARERRLCAVCGQPLNRVSLLGRRGDRSTYGAGCHPRCLEVTLTACPHFTDPGDRLRGNGAVAWRVDGPHLGHVPATDRQSAAEGAQQVVGALPELSAREVQLLASIDPWGTERPATMDADDTVADS